MQQGFDIRTSQPAGKTVSFLAQPVLGREALGSVPFCFHSGDDGDSDSNSPAIRVRHEDSVNDPVKCTLNISQGNVSIQAFKIIAHSSGIGCLRYCHTCKCTVEFVDDGNEVT